MPNVINEESVENKEEHISKQVLEEKELVIQKEANLQIEEDIQKEANIHKEVNIQNEDIKTEIYQDENSAEFVPQEFAEKQNEEFKDDIISEEELRKKAAREEQEKKSKEKAEKARLELEERLRKDEEERIARKKRLEAIMSRTRKNTSGVKSTSPNSEGSQTPEQQQTSAKDQDFVNNVHNKLIIEQNEMNEKKLSNLSKLIKPDIVKEAIKSNFINGKVSNLDEVDIDNQRINLIDEKKSTGYVDDLLDFDNQISGSNINDKTKNDLLADFSELKITPNNAFVFGTQNTSETFTPGAN